MESATVVAIASVALVIVTVAYTYATRRAYLEMERTRLEAIRPALHNLRSALDHAVWQLVIANGETPGRRTMFPSVRSAAEFQERGLHLRAVGPEPVAAIEEVQPYHPPDPNVTPEDSFRWFLDELSNQNKHRVLDVTAGRVAS